MDTYPERASLDGLEIEIFKLVSEGATPEQWAEWLRVPLEHAAVHGNHGLVDKLLGAGANGKAGWKGCDARSLLYAAALGGSKRVVSSLLRAGAQPDVNVLSSAPSSRSPLYQAVLSDHEAAARLLVMAGADVNFEDPEDKRTVLHEAIWSGHEQLARELMIGGADVEARDSRGRTVLHLAAGESLDGIVSDILLRGVDINAVTDEGDSALIYASRSDSGEANLAVVETLLAAGADVNRPGAGGYSALRWASESGNVPVIQALLRYGIDVNMCNSIVGWSALHGAALADQAGAIDALTKAGADMEIKCNIGRTPLCTAAENDSPNALLALLQNGAGIRVQDDERDTPLHLACCFQHEGVQVVVDALLRWGADETALNNDGESPADLLDPAYEGGKCSQEDIERVRLLLARAPADRAWRRRGWLVMLRSRASRSKPIAGGGHEEGSSGASGGAEGSRRVARSEAAGGVADGGEDGQASSGVGEVGNEMTVGEGHGVFRDAVVRLVGLKPEGVFRTVLEFL